MKDTDSMNAMLISGFYFTIYYFLKNWKPITRNWFTGMSFRVSLSLIERNKL